MHFQELPFLGISWSPRSEPKTKMTRDKIMWLLYASIEVKQNFVGKIGADNISNRKAFQATHSFISSATSGPPNLMQIPKITISNPTSFKNGIFQFSLNGYITKNCQCFSEIPTAVARWMKYVV